MDDLARLRMEMVESQIRSRGINNKKILEAVAGVERHIFVPETLRKESYEDRPLPVGFGQTISQPYMVALMADCLKLKGDEKILEIGTGSGYQAAVISRLAKEVFTIEIVEELGQRAERILTQAGYDNIHVKLGDGFDGWEENSPYDGIIITCAVNRIPQPLVEQLREGARLVLPIGESLAVQRLKVLTKHGNQIEEEYILDCVFVPMTGKHGWSLNGEVKQVVL